MSLEEMKLRRLNKLLEAQTSLNDALIEVGATPKPLEEGKKKHHTPKFVQHCVSAITEKPESLERVEKKKNGSPFGICWAQYKKKRRSLATKHSQGKHHTVKDYEGALATLRKEAAEIRASRPSRSQVVFEVVQSPRKRQRALVRFAPEE